MAKYRVEIARPAEKTLFKFPENILKKVLQVIEGLAMNPYPIGCKKLSGELNTFRIRIGDYRIIYEVFDKIVLIKILKIGHRKDVYR